MSAGLSRLLRPKSIAVIGGGTWCANVIAKCVEMGFPGPIYPVHPTKTRIAGVDCIASIADLPEPPDACFVGINRHATIAAVGQLRDIGAGGAVCFANGFLEATGEDADGADLQAQLLDAAGDMTIIGPNCYGFVNYLDGALLWPDQHGGLRIDSGVAIVTQSSNIAINLTMQKRGLPIAYVVTAGNQAQTGMSQIGAALLHDDRVTALGLHIEGLDDLRAFEGLAQTARELGKPIVVLKVGASDQAQAATISHTASLAGSDAGAAALFARLGIAQVHSLPALLETLKLLHVVGPLASNRIASMSCSGGEASLMADSAMAHDVIFPELTTAQQQNLRAALGPLVKLANPLDYNTYIWGDLEAMTATFTAMMGRHLAFGALILDFPRDDRCDVSAWEGVTDAVTAASRASGCPIGIVTTLPENMPEAVADALVAKGIVPLSGIDDALAAIAAAAVSGRGLATSDPVLLPGSQRNTKELTETDAKALLGKYGLRIPQSVRASGAQDAMVKAADIGFPVVLKGEGIAHKSDAGAVALNLQNAAQVADAAVAMPTTDFLIEEMITGTVAELLVGVTRDPAHGYVLTLAAGGVLTELLTDSASLIVPAPADVVAQTLGRLRIAKQLNGFRGQPAADTSAIIGAIMAVQDFVTDHAEHLQEVEINPLICTTTTAIAADALIISGETNERHPD